MLEDKLKDRLIVAVLAIEVKRIPKAKINMVKTARKRLSIGNWYAINLADESQDYLNIIIGHSQRTWSRTEEKTFLVLAKINAEPKPKIDVKKK
jgi:hypothetical protein